MSTQVKLAGPFAQPQYEVSGTAFKPKFISKEFLANMLKTVNPQNPISEFTFYRTYSRYVEELGRRETWLEAVVRASEYSVELALAQLKRNGTYVAEIHNPLLRAEAERLIEYQYNLKTFVSGRTLYTGGSEASYKYPLSNFNCSSAVIDSFGKIAEMFYLLMVGTGFGFRILKEDVAQLPLVRNNFTITHKDGFSKPKAFRLEDTELMIDGNRAVMEIGDSKEGWRQSIDIFFDLVSNPDYAHITDITIDYTSIRPKGERLRVFGGTASGPASMKSMFTVIEKVFKNQLDERIAPLVIENTDDNNVQWLRLRPIHVMDICNSVAYNVVSGGVRRSAQICLFSDDDYETMFAKYGLNGLWGQKSKDTYDKLVAEGCPLPSIEWGVTQDWQTGKDMPFSAERDHLSHRRMSNNSVLFYKKPSRKILNMIVSLLESEGEPGFVNAEEALRRFPYFKGVNPCVEILLDDRGLCNLSTIPVINHVKDGVLDKESLFEAARLSARIGVRMTTITLELPEWDSKQKQHALTGCSLTGWMDAKEATRMSDEEEAVLLRELRKVTKDEAASYAAFLGVRTPANTTAIKPEGTQSLLAGGVSSGLHVAHSPYYIRRIRVSVSDALVLAMQEMGFHLDNEVGQGVTYTDPTTGDEITTEVSTKVAAFPLYSPSKRTKADITVKEQFDTYFRFQKEYTDQNTSNTITVKPDEWEEVESILWERWDEMLAVSFLSYDGGTYQLAPLEEITEEKYNELIKEQPVFDSNVLERFETKEDFDLEDAAACENGICPIR